MTEGEIKSEVNTIIFAGQETVATTLHFIFIMIGSREDVQEKLYKEIKELIFGDTKRDINREDLEEMVYCEGVINETLRLYLSVPVVLRKVDTDIQLSSPLGAYLVTWAAIVAYCYVYIFSMYWFIFVRCQETGDLVAASVVFSLGADSATCVTKFIFMKYYREEMYELISRYLECDTKVAPKTRFHTNLQKQLKVVKRRAFSVWMCLVGIAYLYASMALLRPGRHFPEDLYVVYGLEPPFETPNYEISLFLMALSITVAVYQLSAVKALVIVMIGYVESQVLALSEECLHIWNDVSEENDKRHQNSSDEDRQTDEHQREEIMNLQIRFKLVNILQFHAHNIGLLQEFEKIYRWISFVDFMTIVFAIISELLGRVENTSTGESRSGVT